ncbi:MAG: AMIN domain-containing protein [Limnospira sp.]
MAAAIVGGEAIARVATAVIPNWSLNPETGRVEVQLPDGVRPELAVVANPTRIVLDLPNTQVGVNVTELYESGMVRRVSLTQFQPETARITVDFAPGLVLDAEEIDLRQIGVENQWVLRPNAIQLPPPEPMPPAEPAAVIPAPTQTATASPPPPGTRIAETAPVAPPPARIDPLPDSRAILPNPQPEFYPGVSLLQVPLDRSDRITLLPAEAPPVAPGPVAVGEQILPPSTTATVIPFGEPLPGRSQPGRTRVLPQRGERFPRILLPAGTTLTLRYPVPDDVRLPSGNDRQDVMLLEGGIVDEDGNFVVPPETPVVGQFETTNRGSRFIVRAINLEGRSIPVAAESTWIPGTREVRAENVAIGTGIGGVGGFLVSGFEGLGLLIGAVGGAAVGAVTSPQPTTLEPGQTVQIRLLEDLALRDFVQPIPVVETRPPF